MHGKLCLFSAFMIGAAAGYMYCDYICPIHNSGKKGDMDHVFVVPRSVARKAKKIKKDMQNLWDDMH